jgi:hypothetical protein
MALDRSAKARTDGADEHRSTEPKVSGSNPDGRVTNCLDLATSCTAVDPEAWGVVSSSPSNSRVMSRDSRDACSWVSLAHGMAIEYSIGAEEVHKIGEEGAKQIRTWLDSTYRFRIDQTVYDLDPQGNPYTNVRVPQLQQDKFERFDLVGSLLNEEGRAGRTIYVECKKYSEAGDQGTLYDEYLAVCYLGFVHLSGGIAAPADVEFLWATYHPFAQTNFAKLTTAEQIKAGCDKHAARLGDHAFDQSIAEQLEGRLWLAIVNQRVDEMIMGRELRKAVVAKIVDLVP